MKSFFFSIRYKFMLFFMVTVMVPILLISIISYTLYFSALQEKISTIHHNTTKKSATSIEFILNDVRQLSIDLFNDEALRKVLTYQNKNTNDLLLMINNYEQKLGILISSNKYVKSIYIETASRLPINPIGSNDAIPSAIREEATQLKGRYFWIRNEVKYFYGSPVPTVSLVRLIRDVMDIQKEIGILKINIDDETLTNIYRNQMPDVSSEQLIIDPNGEIISSASDTLLFKENKAVITRTIASAKPSTAYFTLGQGKSQYLVSYYKLAETEWCLVSVVSMHDLLESARSPYNQILITIIISFSIYIIAMLIFIHKLLRPLNDVTQVMKEVENENFKVRLEIKGNDEISTLGNSFNRMSSRLDELLHEVYLVNMRQKEAELRALQAQINPHFLYNTLDTIYWVSCMENAEETSFLVKALGKLFRLSLNRGHEQTTVAREVEHLENYLIIQKKRYDGVIDFEINIEPQVMECRVIKLILQPLVENAIFHGIEPKGELGKITVDVYLDGPYLCYRVADDGVGTDPQPIREIIQQELSVEEHSKHGIALKNVNDRIRLAFGNYYGIEFFSEIGKGTTVRVRQPYIKGDTHDKSTHS